MSELFPKTTAPLGEEVLRVEHVSLRHPERAGDFVVRDVSFGVRRGEVVGLFGLMGAGRTELLQTIFGLHPHTSTGTVHVDGKPCDIRSPAQAIAAGLALAPEDRKADGLVLSMSVAENVSLACLDKTIASWACCSRGANASWSAGCVERLAVKTPSLASAGPQPQRRQSAERSCSPSGWPREPKVLLLDEPTRGIDINAKQEIYAIIDELVRSGLGVVMVSSELPEILADCRPHSGSGRRAADGGVRPRRGDGRRDPEGGPSRGRDRQAKSA